MENVLFILILLGICHLVYESIIMPSVRMELRYKLFSVRDQLLRVKFTKQQDFDQETFNLIYQSINSTIRHLPYFNFSLMYEAFSQFKENRDLNQKVEKKLEKINACEIPEVKRLYSKANKYASLAFLANTGAWFIYLLPVFVILVVFQKVREAYVKTKTQIERLNVIPEKDFHELFPLDSQMEPN